MKRKKYSKTLGDVSVAELLDEFVDLDVVEDAKGVTAMTDEEYVQLMLKKEARKKIAKAKREPKRLKEEREEERKADAENFPERCQTCFYCARVIKVGESFLCACKNSERKPEARYFNYKWWVICQDNPGCWKSPPKSSMDAILRRKVEPLPESEQEADEIEGKAGEELPAHKPPEIVTELDPETEMALAFLRDEVISSSSKRKALETIEKYRKDPPAKRPRKRKKKAPVVSEKIAPEKKCQNCYYCAAQRTIGGSCWCHCTNPARSIEGTNGKSWIKSQLNLPCWKPMKE
jgi:hypothetical protein